MMGPTTALIIFAVAAFAFVIFVQLLSFGVEGVKALLKGKKYP
jgi:hypothetical protein